jgi:hypothetical protein
MHPAEVFVDLEVSVNLLCRKNVPLPIRATGAQVMNLLKRKSLGLGVADIGVFLESLN